jgi:transposase InsO family protein
MSANEKVNRWKLKIQHYDFDIEYIPGEENIVADGFSRLIPNDKEYLNQLDEFEQLCLLDKFVLTRKIYKKISKIHNSVCGHFGVERTVKKLQELGEYWQYMRQHVRKFVKQCPCCQKMSMIKVPIHTHPFTTATYSPMERLNIDTMGPFDPDENNNTYIITIIDCFTRWVELYPVQDVSAKSAAQALLNHVGRFGEPNQILSDNGTQYVNELIKQYTKLVDIEHVRTLSYSKEENSIVERVQKEVLRHLRAIIFDKNVVHRWSTCIPFIQRIINSAIESSIGTSPASLMFGNSINLDRGILSPYTTEMESGEIALSSWTANMLSAQQAVFEAAEKSQRLKDEAHVANYSSQRTEFPVNTYVLVEYHSERPTSKLNTNLRGPLKVVNHKGATYTLENLVTGKQENHHITSLRTFEYDPDMVNPVEVANSDAFSTVVEKIISHVPLKDNYKGVKRSELEFRVRWLNLPEENDRYLPYKELRNNPALHKYLRENNMKTYIPIEHKNAN